MSSEETNPNDEEDESEKYKEDKSENGMDDSKFDDSEETSGKEDKEHGADEEDESEPQTGSNLFYGSFANELNELNETLNQIQIPVITLQHFARDVELGNRALEQFAEDFTMPQQELQGFAQQLEITKEQLRQFEATNRAISRSINPGIFDIYSEVEESPILDLYEVVAAIKQVETEVEVEALQKGNEERAEEIRENSASSEVEKNAYNFVATYILNARDAFSETTTEAAEKILLTDSVWEKRQTFTDLVRTADEQTRVLLEMITHFALTFLVFVFFPSSGSVEDDNDNNEDYD